MLDRTQAPAFKPIKSIQLPELKSYTLPNGVPLYLTDFAEQDVLKLEIYFEAGHLYAEKPGLKALFSKLLLAGTKTKTSNEIVEGFSQYGGFPEITQQVSKFNFTTYGLPKYLKEYINLIVEILTTAEFPEKELITQKQIASQTLSLNLEKPAYLARKKMVNALFGTENPYGSSFEQEDIDDITIQDLKEFFDQRIKSKKFKVFLSGKIGQKEMKIINDTLGQLPAEPVSEKPIIFHKPEINKFLIEKKDNMQSTIRLARFTLGRNDPDFFKMMVCNTTFGGFFGSRLMKNIREDKGYTYGINSSISPIRETAYLAIGTDVIKANTIDTLNEIEKEMKTLRDQLMTEEELELVKNYISGSFAGSVTTAFEVMSRYKNIVLNDLDSSYYNTLIDRISEVNTFDVQRMAQRFLNPTEMLEVIVGERI
ncbi:M16 family metallopeptidase [Jiulongibacter sp. NS-SX5]|uniref:M16 family metallopeptidase n=1 Tax=Jiulongibacter sp. NS-SX5 TaxID=3463854 RepID=UPI004059A6B0